MKNKGNIIKKKKNQNGTIKKILIRSSFNKLKKDSQTKKMKTMKKLTFKFLFALAMLLVSFFAHSQNELKPLYEEFTSSSCIPCAEVNSILDPLLESNSGTHSLIKYQVDWPGDGDPYTTEEVNIRRNYYDVDAAPTLYVNAAEGNLESLTQEFYNSYLGLSSDFKIDIVTAEMDANLNITLNVNIDVSATYEAGLTAHIVVVEKTTEGNVGINGETEFYNVMMKMLPDAYGTALPALTPGTTENLIQSYDMDETFMEQPTDLAVIVFIQDDTDKSILQSKTADVAGDFENYSVNFLIKDESDNPIEGADVYLQGSVSLATNAVGEVTFDEVYPGTYTYNVVAAGYLDGVGSLEIIDEDITITVTMETPQYYWFEMFDTGIPDDWTIQYIGDDCVYWYGGEVIFFKQSGTDDPAMLITPAINVDQADTLFFDMSKGNGEVPLYFGTVTDPTDPETFTSLETYYPEEELKTVGYDLSDLSGDVYFAWKLNTTEFSWFVFDNVIITSEEETILSPSNLTVELSGSDVILDWDAPASRKLSGYNVYHAFESGTFEVLKKVTETNYSHKTTNDGYHQYYVTALYGEEESEATGTVEATVVSNAEVLQKSLSISPNPAKDEINVSLPGNVIKTISIYDYTGTILMETRLDKESCRINTFNLNDGIYIIKIVSGNNHISSSKIIINK